jgi:hypothetical protein
MHHANFANNQQDIMAVVESDDAGLSDASDVAEGGDTSDEEGEFEAWIAQLRELETTQEAKADSLADKLRISLERGQQTALGDLSGEWTLYSKAYLEEAIKVENYNLGTGLAALCGSTRLTSVNRRNLKKTSMAWKSNLKAGK